MRRPIYVEQTQAVRRRMVADVPVGLFLSGGLDSAVMAGAALPSVFTRLPNGDGFQYAIANYISEGGQPLEGFGVTPDEEVKLTRHQLLESQDPVLDAAVTWIEKQQK